MVLGHEPQRCPSERLLVLAARLDRTTFSRFEKPVGACQGDGQFSEAPWTASDGADGGLSMANADGLAGSRGHAPLLACGRSSKREGECHKPGAGVAGEARRFTILLSTQILPSRVAVVC